MTVETKSVVGVSPWLPWPLCTWPAWTEPVRAERLAALRIIFALVLLVDVATSHAPCLRDFYGPDSLSRVGDLDLFARVIEPPRWNWSLLRGFGHAANLVLIVVTWSLLTGWMGVAALGRVRCREAAPSFGLFLAWTAAAVLAVLAVWSRIHTLPVTVAWEDSLWLGAAAVPWVCAAFFLGFAVWTRCRHEIAGAAVALLSATLLLLTGAAWRAHWLNLDSWTWLLEPFDTNPAALTAAMALWLGFQLMMLIGLGTRTCVLGSWVLMLSFDNLNHLIASNGDVVRNIVHFYLLLTPCGAVWSVDRWLSRRFGGGQAATLFVHPWWLRLLFLQLVLIYFCNGAYKLMGESCCAGTSLYYVLAEPTMTRVAFGQLPIPAPFLTVGTYTVLIWELAFPFLMPFRWTRLAALWMGALFHLGIWATLELGPFAPYMLVMYVPLLPWEKWHAARGA